MRRPENSRWSIFTIDSETSSRLVGFPREKTEPAERTFLLMLMLLLSGESIRSKSKSDRTEEHREKSKGAPPSGDAPVETLLPNLYSSPSPAWLGSR